MGIKQIMNDLNAKINECKLKGTFAKKNVEGELICEHINPYTPLKTSIPWCEYKMTLNHNGVTTHYCLREKYIKNKK